MTGNGIALPVDDARDLASLFLANVAPWCRQARIAGSLRRALSAIRAGDPPPPVHDIEIVVVASDATRATEVTLFGERGRTHAVNAKLLDRLDQLDYIEPRTDGGKRVAWGDRWRACLWMDVPLDLFIVQEDAWGVQYAIRTGPAAFSHRLVTQRHLGGLLPDFMRVKDGRLWEHRGGTWHRIPMHDEDQWSAVAGIDLPAPHLRR